MSETRRRRQSGRAAPFQSARQGAALADASSEFKVALTSMRSSAKEFVAQPSQSLIAQFAMSHDNVMRSLDKIEAAYLTGSN